jgi:hypothetical protein
MTWQKKSRDGVPSRLETEPPKPKKSGGNRLAPTGANSVIVQNELPDPRFNFLAPFPTIEDAVMANTLLHVV